VDGLAEEREGRSGGLNVETVKDKDNFKTAKNEEKVETVLSGHNEVTTKSEQDVETVRVGATWKQEE
jgi:hypothetical protein